MYKEILKDLKPVRNELDNNVSQISRVAFERRIYEF